MKIVHDIIPAGYKIFGIVFSQFPCATRHILMLFTLADLLGSHLQRTRTSVNRLAGLSGVPQRTIANWLNGQIRKPHQWQAIVKVAQALHLTESETSDLLRSAGHPTVAKLREIGTPSERDMLADVRSSFSGENRRRPFQAIADSPIFVGRSREMEELTYVLTHERRGVICGIQGMGGVGKTSLAARLSYRLMDAFPDGVLWARLDVSDTLSILGSFAEAFGKNVSHFKDVESRASVVRNLLAEKRALIVLDNVESSAQARPLLPPSAGTCAMLITTRRDLSILDGRKRVLLEPFHDHSEDALLLFERYLGDPFVRAHRASLIEIAAIVGNLPLALTIVAGRLTGDQIGARTETGRVSALLDSLRVSSARLDALMRDDLGVRASFESSYLTLTPFQKELFSTLGVFDGKDFGSDAASFLIGRDKSSAATELNLLHQLCLLQKDGFDRWHLHPLLRDFAREKLDAEGWMQKTVERTMLMFQQAAKGGWIFKRTLEDELPNIRFALDQASKLKLHPLFLETVRALYPILSNGAWYSLARKILEQAREAARGLNDLETDVFLLKGLSLAQIGLGESQSAGENLSLALRLARSANYEEGAAEILLTMGKWEHDRGYRRKSNAYLEESLALARKLNNAILIGKNLNGLAANFVTEARYAEAQEMFVEALSISRSHPNVGDTHRVLMNLGEISWQKREWDAAEAYWQEALALARTNGYRPAETVLLSNLSKSCALRSNWPGAEMLLDEALSLALELNSPRVECIVRYELGRVLSQQGKYQAALLQLNQGKRLADESGDLESKGVALYYLGLLYHDCHEISRSLAELEEALLIAKEIDNKIMTAEIYFAEARAFLASKKIALARKMAGESLQIYERLGLTIQEKELHAWMHALR